MVLQAIVSAPLIQSLPRASRVLLAGAGGGYDVIGAIPLLLELEAVGHEVHLGSLSFTNLRQLQGAIEEAPGLFQVFPEAASEEIYCPEAWLASWLKKRSGRKTLVWAWEKTGVQPLSAHFGHLCRRLALDVIILVDGGIDVILRGDETSLGTPAEDLCSLAAVQRCGVKQRMIACIGLGAELRDGIKHAQVLERISELASAGGYLGASALVDQTKVGAAYREAVEYIFEHQSRQHRSHVHRVILAAMAGEFGAVAAHVWLSPLLNMFWFFDLGIVANTHLFLEHLSETQSIGELVLYIRGFRKGLKIQEKKIIPI